MGVIFVYNCPFKVEEGINKLKIRIGAIGAVDSLEKIKEVAAKDNRIQFIGFSYDNYDELKNILRQYKNKVDQWIFSFFRSLSL